MVDVMDPETVALVVAGAGVVGSVIGGGITAVATRGKNRADATKSITEAAASIVQKIDDDNDVLRQEIVDVRQEVARLKRQHEADRKAQQLHVSWDQIARERLQAVGIALPEPPPLYAPDVP